MEEDDDDFYGGKGEDAQQFEDEPREVKEEQMDEGEDGEEEEDDEDVRICQTVKTGHMY